MRVACISNICICARVCANKCVLLVEEKVDEEEERRKWRRTARDVDDRVSFRVPSQEP